MFSDGMKGIIRFRFDREQMDSVHEDDDGDDQLDAIIHASTRGGISAPPVVRNVRPRRLGSTVAVDVVPNTPVENAGPATRSSRRKSSSSSSSRNDRSQTIGQYMDNLHRSMTENLRIPRVWLDKPPPWFSLDYRLGDDKLVEQWRRIGSPMDDFVAWKTRIWPFLLLRYTGEGEIPADVVKNLKGSFSGMRPFVDRERGFFANTRNPFMVDDVLYDVPPYKMLVSDAFGRRDVVTSIESYIEAVRRGESMTALGIRGPDGSGKTACAIRTLQNSGYTVYNLSAATPCVTQPGAMATPPNISYEAWDSMFVGPLSTRLAKGKRSADGTTASALVVHDIDFFLAGGRKGVVPTFVRNIPGMCRTGGSLARTPVIVIVTNSTFFGPVMTFWSKLRPLSVDGYASHILRKVATDRISHFLSRKSSSSSGAAEIAKDLVQPCKDSGNMALLLTIVRVWMASVSRGSRDLRTVAIDHHTLLAQTLAQCLFRASPSSDRTDWNAMHGLSSDPDVLPTAALDLATCLSGTSLPQGQEPVTVREWMSLHRCVRRRVLEFTPADGYERDLIVRMRHPKSQPVGCSNHVRAVIMDPYLLVPEVVRARKERAKAMSSALESERSIDLLFLNNPVLSTKRVVNQTVPVEVGLSEAAARADSISLADASAYSEGCMRYTLESARVCTAGYGRVLSSALCSLHDIYSYETRLAKARSRLAYALNPDVSDGDSRALSGPLAIGYLFSSRAATTELIPMLRVADAVTSEDAKRRYAEMYRAWTWDGEEPFIVCGADGTMERYRVAVDDASYDALVGAGYGDSMSVGASSDNLRDLTTTTIASP